MNKGDLKLLPSIFNCSVWALKLSEKELSNEIEKSLNNKKIS